MDRRRLNIGVYCLQPYARTEGHIRELKEAGVDCVISMEYDRKTLDLMEKHGLGCIVSGIVPGWWGGGDKAGTFEETHPLSLYEEAARAFEDHPAIWGIDLGDEPSAIDMPHYGRVAAMAAKLFPGKIPYINLYPHYGAVASNTPQRALEQLGTANYREHIDAYCRLVPTDYISFDHYMYSVPEEPVRHFLSDLGTVSDARKATSRDLWVVLQVNSNRESEWISLDQLRFQAFTAMAYGARNITWACWTAGWWHNQVLDANGEKTEQYEKLRQVNREIHSLAAVYDRYRVTNTYITASLDTGFLRVRTASGQTLIAGEMHGEGNALFIMPAGDPFGDHPCEDTLLIDCPQGTPRCAGLQGPVDIKQSITLRSNEPVIIMT